MPQTGLKWPDGLALARAPLCARSGESLAPLMLPTEHSAFLQEAVGNWVLGPGTWFYKCSGTAATHSPISETSPQAPHSPSFRGLLRGRKPETYPSRCLWPDFRPQSLTQVFQFSDFRFWPRSRPGSRGAQTGSNDVPLARVAIQHGSDTHESYGHAPATGIGQSFWRLFFG
jgi:hypothetical protein